MHRTDAPLNTPIASLAEAAAFSALAVGWLCVVGLITGLVAVLTVPNFNPSQLPSWALALSALLQNIGWVALAAALLYRARLPLAAGLALRPFSRTFAALAALCGLTVGVFPGWLAARLTELIPTAYQLGSLDTISTALLSGALWQRAAVLFAIVIAAPICEELVFRGYLWSTLSRALPTWLVWLITSLAFAAMHGDPVHVIAISFTGAVLGWLRWMSGSIYVPMIAHFTNNALAAGATFYVGQNAPTEPPSLLVLTGLSLTLGLAAFARRLSSPS